MLGRLMMTGPCNVLFLATLYVVCRALSHYCGSSITDRYFHRVAIRYKLLRVQDAD